MNSQQQQINTMEVNIKIENLSLIHTCQQLVESMSDTDFDKMVADRKKNRQLKEVQERQQVEMDIDLAEIREMEERHSIERDVKAEETRELKERHARELELFEEPIEVGLTVAPPSTPVTVREPHLFLMVPPPSPDISMTSRGSVKKYHGHGGKHRDEVEMVFCDCGQQLKKASYKVHLKSKRHLTALEERKKKIQQNIQPLISLKKEIEIKMEKEVVVSNPVVKPTKEKKMIDGIEYFVTSDNYVFGLNRQYVGEYNRERNTIIFEEDDDEDEDDDESVISDLTEEV